MTEKKEIIPKEIWDTRRNNEEKNWKTGVNPIKGIYKYYCYYY